MEDKPILLSIGYAACHWCHVMAHESFEDESTAAIMNRHFINVKVDREERPDIDNIYMQAVQSLTGHGGWPMTVFLLPDGHPFFGGTYFPPTDRHGMPSFKKVLESVAEAYRDQRHLLANNASKVMSIYKTAEAMASPTGSVTPELLQDALTALVQRYDHTSGGFFSGAPKFPPTMALDFLLRSYARTGAAIALEMTTQTFLKMTRGGIYDHIGGGLARYAVDALWQIPHFEKMLYDNALLIRFGSHLYEVTKNDEVKDRIEQTVEWLAREMTSPDGGWYSSYDADSEGHEGKFYVWNKAEIKEVLTASANGSAEVSQNDADTFIELFGVTDSGNFEGSNILNLSDANAERLMADKALLNTVNQCKNKLYEYRAKRIWPGLDNKIIAAWNGLALMGVADAASAFKREDFKDLAIRNGQFLKDNLVRDGRVFRLYRQAANSGSNSVPSSESSSASSSAPSSASSSDSNLKSSSESSYNLNTGSPHASPSPPIRPLSPDGFLEDYAAVALGFLSLFELTLDRVWLDTANQILDKIIELFWDPNNKAFYDSSSDSEKLITRPRDVADNAMPSGTSLAVDLLMRMANYTNTPDHRHRGQFILDSLAQGIVKFPTSFGHLLCAAEYASTFACHGDFCDMPSPAALDIALKQHLTN